MPPLRSRLAVRLMASSPSAIETGAPATSNQSRGPHSAQLLVSEWYRRLPGDSYSSRHAAHCVNARIVVRSRSYGIDSMTVNRGPQSVHVMNG